MPRKICVVKLRALRCVMNGTTGMTRSKNLVRFAPHDLSLRWILNLDERHVYLALLVLETHAVEDAVLDGIDVSGSAS